MTMTICMCLVQLSTKLRPRQMFFVKFSNQVVFLKYRGKDVRSDPARKIVTFCHDTLMILLIIVLVPATQVEYIARFLAFRHFQHFFWQSIHDVTQGFLALFRVSILNFVKKTNIFQLYF